MEEICVFGTGMIGRSFINLCTTRYPEFKIHAFDHSLEAINKISQSSVLKYSRLSDVLEHAGKFIFCATPWKGFREIVNCLDDRENRIIIGIDRPPSLGDWKEFIKKNNHRKDLIIPCIGIEPGLSEILLCNLLDKNQLWSSIEINCGGLVLPIPQNPLKYKRLFGDLHLPFDSKKAYYIKYGHPVATERFSGLEYFEHPNLGWLECYHDGLRMPLVEHLNLNAVEKITQKTLRWKGHSDCIRTLTKLGVIDKNIYQNLSSYTPKRIFEIINKDLLSLKEEDVTISLLNLKAIDNFGNTRLIYLTFSDLHELNSMELATILPGLFLIQLFSRLRTNHKGVVLPENIIRGELFEKLITNLLEYQVQVFEDSYKAMNNNG